MQANRRSDTDPERRLRSALHARGLRFRKDFRLSAAGRPVRPDIVFTRSRVAVFVDGCFWHRCPVHATDPRANAAFWERKFERNVERDGADNAALVAAGWSVVRVWEHEDPEVAAERVVALLA
jgi:DNA mismatch endonuclease (patch repair protein)